MIQKINRTNLFLHGKTEDKIKLGYAGKPIFTALISDLPRTSAILELGHPEIQKSHMKTIFKEVISYITRKGTQAQRKALKIEKKRLIIFD